MSEGDRCLWICLGKGNPNRRVHMRAGFFEQGGIVMNEQKLNSPTGQRPLGLRKVFGSKLVSLLLLLTGMESLLIIPPVGAAIGTCGNGVVDKFEECDG